MIYLNMPLRRTKAGWPAFTLIAVLLFIVACRRPLEEIDPTVEITPTAYPLAKVTTTPPAYPAAGATANPSAYPLPSATREVPAYPLATATPTATTPTATRVPAEVSPSQTPTRSSMAQGNASQSFLPLVAFVVPKAISAPTPVPTPTIAPLDFAEIRAGLQASGQDIAFAKIGFHVTFPNDQEKEALYGYLRALDEAGVPFFLKSASNAEPLYFAQGLMAASGVPHTLVYRSTIEDVPHYELSPELAAEVHWQTHRDAFPPELDPSLVWIETLNEVDKERSEWLAQFALETAGLAMADGFNWAAFGWSSGEPEPEQWQSPAMLEFLRLAGDNPQRLAIALHEYSFLNEDIGHEYPHKVGRFQELFRVADQHGIPRPTVLITEWGWTYDSIPSPNRAMRDIRWAASLYAPFPQVKGAAIWNLGRLGCCSYKPSVEVRELIRPLTEFSLTRYFAVPLPPEQAAPEPGLYAP